MKLTNIKVCTNLQLDIPVNFCHQVGTQHSYLPIFLCLAQHITSITERFVPSRFVSSLSTVLSVNSHHRRTGNYSESNFSLAVNMMKMMEIFFTVSLNLHNSMCSDAKKRTRRPLHVVLLLQHKFSSNVNLNSDFESCLRENSRGTSVLF